MNEYERAIYDIISLLADRGFSVDESEKLLMRAVRELKVSAVTVPPQHLKG